MFHSSIRRLLSLLCLLLMFWLQIFSSEAFSALAVSLPSNPPQAVAEKSSEWNDIDADIVKAVKKVRPSTEEFAVHELDSWIKELMKQVDEGFLNWYFGFIHQKATQDGVPFAWLAFKVDFLDVLKAQDEKGLTPNQIIQKRMLEEFEQKFNELVLNEAAINDLRDRIEHIANNYVSALGFQIELVGAKHHIPHQDWDQHISQISKLIYNTGTSEFSLSSESLSSLLASRFIGAASVAIGTKLAMNFGVKMAPKLAIDTGFVVILETTVKFVDPLLIAGLLIWDAADYQLMVNKSKPELRKNIKDYLVTVKNHIYDDPDGSITTVIDEMENLIINTVLK